MNGEIIEALADALDKDAGELAPETELSSLGWDSMSILSVIAMAKTRFGKTLTGAQIREFKTVQDIIAALV